MDSKDFGFLYRKEIIILCLLLLAISYAQIASEQQLLFTTRNSGINPIFILRNNVFEALGIFLPVFTAIYLFFQKRSNDDFSWIPPGKYLAVFTTLFILILAIPIPSTSEDIPPDNNNITVTITIPITATNPTSTLNPSETTHPSNSDPSINSQFLGTFLNIARNMFIFLVLFLPLLIILLLRYKSKSDTGDFTDIKEDENSESEKAYLARSILECYYQASNRLEERGADDSPAFTPIEFLKDVINKKLILPQDIEELTQIFEEAKFSQNEMTNEQVEVAKKIARSIIFAQEEILSELRDEQKSREEDS